MDELMRYWLIAYLRMVTGVFTSGSRVSYKRESFINKAYQEVVCVRVFLWTVQNVEYIDKV